jgi:hypothetical protein
VSDPQFDQEWSERLQAEWIDRYLPIFMAKQSVVGIFWASYSDAADHDFPYAGLIRDDGSPKSSLDTFRELRAGYQRGRDLH